MGLRPNFIVFTLIFWITAMLTSGCALNKVNLVDNGTVLLERVPAKDVYVASAYVFQDDSEMVISGKVKRVTASSGIPHGDVHITIIAPDGTVIKELNVQDKPASIKKIYQGESSFTVRFPLIPPAGTKIRLAYHHSDAGEE